MTAGVKGPLSPSSAFTETTFSSAEFTGNLLLLPLPLLLLLLAAAAVLVVPTCSFVNRGCGIRSCQKRRLQPQVQLRLFVHSQRSGDVRRFHYISFFLCWTRFCVGS